MGLTGHILKSSLQRFDSFNIEARFDDIVLWADVAVGPTILVIGIMGLNELRTEHEGEIQTEVDETQGVSSISPSPADFKKLCKSCSLSIFIFMNGLLLGFSWDGLPSLGPALTASSMKQLLKFLISYAVGTMLAMGTIACTVGVCTQWLKTSSLSTRGLPRRLAYVSSLIATVIGVTWIIQSIIRHASPTPVEYNDGFRPSSSSILPYSSTLSNLCSIIAIIIVFINVLDEFGYPILAIISNQKVLKPFPMTV
jgi:hypothetical protein